MSKKPSFAKYLAIGGVVVGGGVLVLGRKLWAGVATTQQSTAAMIEQARRDAEQTSGKIITQADQAMTKQVESAVEKGRAVVGSASDEAALVAAQVGLEAQDLVSVKRLVRDFLESDAEQASRISLENEAAIWRNQIIAAVRTFETQGYLSSVKLNEVARLLLENAQRVKAGHSGKSVLPAAFVGAAEKILAAAAEKKAVMYPRDAYAVMTMTAANLTWMVSREKLVDQENELNGLYGILDRNTWATRQDISAGRKMWYQMVAPAVETAIKAFLAKVAAGGVVIYEKGFGKPEPMLYAEFKKEYL